MMAGRKESVSMLMFRAKYAGKPVEIVTFVFHSGINQVVAIVKMGRKFAVARLEELEVY